MNLYQYTPQEPRLPHLAHLPSGSVLHLPRL
jgi:hypothetical protein